MLPPFDLTKLTDAILRERLQDALPPEEFKETIGVNSSLLAKVYADRVSYEFTSAMTNARIRYLLAEALVSLVKPKDEARVIYNGTLLRKLAESYAGYKWAPHPLARMLYEADSEVREIKSKAPVPANSKKLASLFHPSSPAYIDNTVWNKIELLHYDLDVAGHLIDYQRTKLSPFFMTLGKYNIASIQRRKLNQLLPAWSYGATWGTDE